MESTVKQTFTAKRTGAGARTDELVRARRTAGSAARLPRQLDGAHPLALELALEAADGNARRLVVEPDGSVFVSNFVEW